VSYYQSTDYPQEKVLLVGVMRPSDQRWQIEENLTELAQLAYTAGCEVIDQVIQTKERIDPAYYIGQGKAREIANRVARQQISLLIFDDALSPGQLKNLQRLMGKAQVMDRNSLILEIFARHAHSREAQTQVELARLMYLLPRLPRQWTHLERQRGGTGTRGGMGETQIEIDRRLIRKRISWLKNELQKIEQQRETRRRQRKGIFKVALVGYTNAGKSSLMNILTGAKVEVEDKLFATLDTTVRRVRLKGYPILLSDTVGFIRKLPHHLVASFRSTLREVEDADLILKLVDVSHPNYQQQITIVEQVLRDIGAWKQTSILVFNKIDRLNSPETLTAALRQYPNAVPVSVLRHINLAKLEARIVEAVEQTLQTRWLSLPLLEQSKWSTIQRLAEVLDTELENYSLKIKVRAREATLNYLERLCLSQESNSVPEN